MKITKFEHACFVVENNGESLIVDPGGWTTDLVVPSNVTVIVLTHEHPDHFSRENLTTITEKNPEAVIVAHESITSLLNELRTQAVTANEGIKIGGFELEFCGGEHAVIRKDLPAIPNLGVAINGRIYYPGDSFAKPERDVEILALPVAAPWLKISETIDFLLSVKPHLTFPTHDVILSETGKSLVDNMLLPVSQSINTQYQRLNEPLEV